MHPAPVMKIVQCLFALGLLALLTVLPLAADELPRVDAEHRADALPQEQLVEFARDVLPILSANCFSCHGPDENERQAELRLDLEADAKRSRGEGAAIVAGRADASSLIARLISSDLSEVMPPPDSGKHVEPQQIETIRRWIDQGAQWQRHWAFQPLAKPAGALDDLVAVQLASRGLKLQAAASPHTLARRLSLDLIGLPPTPELADALAADPSPQAYERLVDDLLSSPRFGEHWARMWLDLARYADTKGYEKDLGRTMWPYRDWVIDALNSDMPLDQFTLEQLAGDLLPEPTSSQIIATAFHRNTMANDEGGTDDEEFRVAAVKDRVNTTVQVWMGLTMGCAQCHSHKYDPISLEDYYRFFAIFDQTEDADRHDDAPRMSVMSADQEARKQELEARVSQLKNQLQQAQEQAQEQAADKSDGGDMLWHPAAVTDAKSKAGATLSVTAEQAIEASGTSAAEDTYEITVTLQPGSHRALRLEALPTKQADALWVLGRNPRDPNFVISELTVHAVDGDAERPLELTNPLATFAQDGWPIAAAIDGDVKTGWAVAPRKHERQVAIFLFAEPVQFQDPTPVRVTITQAYGDQLTLAKLRLSTSEADPQQLTLEARSPQCRQLAEELSRAQQQLTALKDQVAQLPIMRQLHQDKRRVSRIHNRGNFLDQGDAVEPAVLGSFHPLPQSMSPDRLGVAHWLVSPENPLTPRVWANRVWSRLFGRGLVETEEDFGAVGSPPTHPELLDWLAAEYRDRGWSLKRLLKTIVLSETYRQDSAVNPSLLDIDPLNTFASRGARYRLSGEQLRDQALAVSGLLSQKMGGPPVMPPQPEGLWRSTYNGQQWIDAKGEDRFRRGLYTYLKRTTPYPSLTTFDGGSGEVCLIRRIRTNTPLQALVTLNDPVFLEAAAALAQRMLSGVTDAEAQVEKGLRLALIRPARSGECDPLVQLLATARSHFEREPEQAEALLAACRAAGGEVPPAELAAWVVVANAIMNLDEFLTRN